jgi:methylmalonyl-CoA epimerase
MSGSPNFAIDHLGIAVSSLEEALRFWQTQLGMTLLGTEQVPAEKVSVAMLQAGESRLELLQASDADSTIARFVEKRGPGLHHVAIRVARLEEAAENLRAQGARLLNEPQVGAGGHRYVFVHPASTGGVLLELIEEHSSIG